MDDFVCYCTERLLREESSLQGYPVQRDKTPEASSVRTRHRRAYEDWPQEKAEGAHARLLASVDGELNRDIS
jgi:hypothetical protein